MKSFSWNWEHNSLTVAEIQTNSDCYNICKFDREVSVNSEYSKDPESRNVAGFLAGLIGPILPVGH